MNANTREKWKSYLKKRARPPLPFSITVAEDGGSYQLSGTTPQLYLDGRKILPGETVSVTNERVLVVLCERGVADPDRLKRIDQMCECGEYPDENGHIEHDPECKLVTCEAPLCVDIGGEG